MVREDGELAICEFRLIRILWNVRERGVERHEIEETIESGLPIVGKQGRLGKRKVYEFRQTRHGKFFEQKRVEVFYVIEEAAIITVTTYRFTANGR